MSLTSRNLVANYFGQAWSAVMGLAFTPMYIRYLGMEAYGLVGLFAVMQSCLSVLDMGMTPTLNREMARFTAGAHSTQAIRNLLRSLETICFSLAAVIIFTLWAASGYLANDWLRSDRLQPGAVAQALRLMALVVALRFCEGLYRSSLLGLQRQVRYNAAHAVLATVRHSGAAAVVAWLSPSIGAFFLWQAAVSIVTLLVFAISVYATFPAVTSPVRFSTEALAGVWKFAAGIMGISLLALLLTQIDKILLSRLLPLQSFGYYSLAATIAGVLYMIIGPITQAIYPRLVELSAAREEQQSIVAYHKGAQCVTALTAPVVSLMSCFAGGIVYTWSGDATVANNTAPILSALMLGTFLNGLMWMPYHCQLAHGWTQLTLKVNTAAVALLIPAILWVVPRYGAVGAAWMWVVLNLGYVLIAVQLMHNRLMRSEKWRWYYDDVLLPIAAAAGVTLLSKAFQPPGYYSRPSWFVFLTFVGGAALVASTMSANRIRSRLVTMYHSWRQDVTRDPNRLMMK